MRASVAAVLAVLVLVGGWARFSVDESLWFDEVITLEEASRPSLLDTITAKVVHPPLVRVTSRLSVAALGGSRPADVDLALRAPSMLMGTLAIVLVFLFAREFADDDRVGLVAAAAWALLPYGRWCSSEARFYGALVLFSAWTLYALARMHRAPSLGRRLGLALPLLFGLYTHYLFGLLFVLSAATVWMIPRRTWSHSLPWAIAAAGFLPWIAFALPRLNAEARTWADPLAHQLRNVPVSFFTGRLGYYHLHDHMWGFRLRDAALWGSVALLGLGIAAHLARRWRGAGRLTAVVLLPALVITAGAHWALVQTPFFHPKYLAFVYPFACLSLGELAAALVQRDWDRRARFGLAVVALVALVPIALAVAQVSRSGVARQPYAGAAAWIAERRKGEPVVVLDCSRRYNALALRHYGLAPPLAHLPCEDEDEAQLLPAERAFAVLTHWGDERTRARAVDVLRARYGEVTARTRLRGVESDVVVLVFEDQAASRSSARRSRSLPARSSRGSAGSSSLASTPWLPSQITNCRSRIQSSIDHLRAGDGAADGPICGLGRVL